MGSAISENTAEAIRCMAGTAQKRNSEILRVYQSGGDLFHKDEHLLCLTRPVEGQEVTVSNSVK